MTTSSTLHNQDDRWQMLGGDRFYTVARWFIIALLFLVIPLFGKENVFWPISISGSESSPPSILTFWGYVGFSLLITIVIFIPQLGSLLSYSYIADIIFISLIALFEGDRTTVLFPLYLLPLINAAIRHPTLITLVSGIFAAVCYVAANLVANIGTPSSALGGLDYVSLLFPSLTLILIPWLTSGLAENWSASNRRSVNIAKQQTDEALNEARSYRDQMRSLYEVAYALSTTIDHNHVLETALKESRKLVPYTAGVVLLSSGNPDELYVSVGHEVDVKDLNQKILIGRGLLTATLRSADPRFVADISQEPDLRTIGAFQQCKAACLIPLRSGLQTYGLIVIASSHAKAFTNEQLDMLTALSNYAIIALQNAQLIFDLKEERNKLISKEEEVRHQLARDLHDGPAQTLAAITMNVEFIKRLLDRDPSRVIPELDKLSELAKHTTYEVRTMLFELRPLALETQGLQVTLEQYLARFKSADTNSGTEIVLETKDVEDVALDTKTEGTLFNIIQEGVNNALKHARASRIWVQLNRKGNMLRAVVKDDGVGFDRNKVLRSYEKRGSFGLLNIDERARLVGGYAELNSTPGEGTIIEVVVPIEH